jgi:raffinose/stachyose/melibiose transport system substrate-binding protein
MRSMKIASLAAAAALALAACGGSGGEDPGDGRIAGEITVLTHRTDVVGTRFEDYKRRFNQVYPDVKVTFEALTNYEDEVRIRMNTDEYGDVLLIPGALTADQFADFFEPLGPTDEMSRKYRFMNKASYQGTAYGIAITGNADGLVYNKRIWREAGVTQIPRTPEEFLAALQAVKDHTQAVPLYTNYAAGFALAAQWTGHVGAVSADPDAMVRLADTDAPWTPGSDLYVIDSLLYDAVQRGLTEADPTTTEWEASKQRLADGQIATMSLGLWAVAQIQPKAANPDDVGFMPFPTQVDGKFHSVISGDYMQGINVHSTNKRAARAWVDWFADQSNYAADEGGVSPLLNGPEPSTLNDFKALDVQYFELTPDPPGKEGLVNRIDKKGEVGINDFQYRQRLVDAARGARQETKDQIFAELNQKWAASRAKTD